MRIITFGNILKGFKDTFLRSNETLERSSDGGLWNIVRGSWSVSSNKLYTATSPSTYPIISADVLSASVDISIKDISQGTTTALWVTDSGNWWGLGIDQVTLVGDNNNATGCDCATCTGANYEGYYYACGTYTYYVTNYVYCCNVVGNRYCSSYNTSNCKSWYYSKETGKVCTGGYNSSNCASYNSGNCNESPPYCVSGSSPVTNTNYCVGYNITGYYTYTCNCVTCYPQYVRLIKSISDTVSTVVSSLISNNKIIRSIKTLVRGDKLVAEVYENSDLTGKIGSDLVYEPTGVALTTKYGVLVKPSSYNQGNTNGEIDIKAVYGGN
jgi:hypothetical protein